MSYELNTKLVIGISARALFDLREENRIFEEQGVDAYVNYQVSHEEEPFKKGSGFALIRALLNWNTLPGMENQVEVILLSHNSPEVSLRIYHSIEYYKLPISRAVFVSGASIAKYLDAFHTDLFLSACEEDVQAAVDAGIAAGIIYQKEFPTEDADVMEPMDPVVRIAFDGDAVLFSDESERIFEEQGMEAFVNNERSNACCPLPEGPFARLLKKFATMRENCKDASLPIRIALVTARCAPAHERVIRTLREWKVQIDEAFFLGGIAKKDILQAFGAHIFFDDQQIHTLLAADAVPAARVPYRSRGQKQKENETINISA